MPDHTIHLETPAPPDLAPQVSELRERLARVEERTLNPASDPASSESLSLASEARTLVGALEDRVKSLEAKSESALTSESSEVAEVAAPPPLESPATEQAPEPNEAPEANREPHPAWWNPTRYL